MTRASSMLAALASLGLAALGGAQGATAQTRQLTIADFDATYTVHRDASLVVEERITLRFEGSWRGIYRSIPVVYDLSDGGRHEIRLDLRAVEDGRGRSLRHETDRRGALIEIKTYVPDAVNATRTVVYRYRVHRGLRQFEGEEGMGRAHDELYWNVTGTEWEMPIERARATVRLPDGATGVRAAAYTGPFGATGQEYRHDIRGELVEFETTGPLGMREGLTIVVGWDAGLIEGPGIGRRLVWFFADFPFLFLPIGAFALMFTLWRRRGRDPELNRSIMPEYEPPAGLRPAELGTLMDFRMDPRDLSATIIDLAVRGYLKIEEVPGKLLRPKDHILHIVRGPDEWGDELEAFERELLESLHHRASAGGYEGARKIRVSKLKQKFYKDVPAIRDAVYRRLIWKKAFAARPDRVVQQYLLIGGILGVLAFVLAINLAERHVGDPAGTWISFLAVPAIVIGFGLAMPARTRRGAELLAHALGLREYIDRVDRERLKHATLEHFERLLPYAAALGLEEKWTEAFEGILSEPPGWYVGHGPGRAFHASSFSRSIGRMTAATGAALTTAPRSASGGSGFGGGGGSGGGFGGGGGRGF